ncbi:hypothetical protein [Vibrio harveyi]|uniref:hypothetical protein n=1 Tax=Vibrio harveyi TaxID=669 RepID=UPI003CEBE1C0
MTKISERIEKLIITKMIAILSTDIKDLGAYKLGLIDKNGSIKREPRTDLEKRALNPSVRFMLTLRPYLLSSNIMRDVMIKELRRKQGIYSEFNSAVDSIQISEQSYDISDLLNEMKLLDEDSLMKEIDDFEDEQRDKKSSEKYQLLASRKRRRKIIRGLFGLSDTLSTPVLGDKAIKARQ